MHRLVRWMAIVAAATTALLAGPAVLAHAEEDDGASHAVFVQLNDPGGNAIEAFARASNGTLTAAASYPTGGLGQRALKAGSDPLASQDSLVYDREHGLLFAVNAGSDTISVFRVSGTTLTLRQVIGSGGAFPASIAVSENLVYVLDAGGPGNIQGYRIAGGRLRAISGSNRTLGLGNTNPPFFLNSPPQVGFTPDGSKLIVTTKFGSGSVDVFLIGESGRPSTAPVVNPVGGAPFAFNFDRDGRLILVNAASSSVATYRVREDGTIALVGSPVPDGQGAACWITAGRGVYFVANTAAGSVSVYRIDEKGAVVLINPVAAGGVTGAIDEAAAPGGHYLYVQALTSTLDEFAVHEDGSLTLIGSVPTGPNQEGLVAA